MHNKRLRHSTTRTLVSVGTRAAQCVSNGRPQLWNEIASVFFAHFHKDLPTCHQFSNSRKQVRTAASEHGQWPPSTLESDLRSKRLLKIRETWRKLRLCVKHRLPSTLVKLRHDKQDHANPRDPTGLERYGGMKQKLAQTVTHRRSNPPKGHRLIFLPPRAPARDPTREDATQPAGINSDSHFSSNNGHGPSGLSRTHRKAHRQHAQVTLSLSWSVD